ncbi:MAG: efflux RND transporter periplasmic adaptor subunit [Elusimicrobiota bacterium]
MRKLIYFLAVVLFAGVTVYKARLKKEASQKEIVSIRSYWQEYGKPVRVEPVKQGVAHCITKVSGIYRNRELIAEVPPQVHKKIEVGQNYTARKNGEKLSGEITYISSTRELNTGFYRVKLSVENSSAVKEGDIIVAKVRTKRLENVLKIPTSSILNEEEEAFVWIVTDKEVRKRKVETGILCNGFTQITEGLKKGEIVCKEGMSELEEKDKVNILNKEIIKR